MTKVWFLGVSPMLRSFFSIAAICSLLFVSIAAPAANAARRKCPEEPPSTLLSLYRKSDAVYLGKFEKTVAGDMIRTDEYSRTIAVSDSFSISTAIKGEPRKFFVREYEEYQYAGSDDEGLRSEEPMEEFNEGYRLKPGDNVVLFLKFVEDEDSKENVMRELDVVHYRDGVMRLDVSELSSYEARLQDLKGILSSKQVSDAAILNWIIRCIEDPITRWEGAYELFGSFQMLDWDEQNTDTVDVASDEPENGDSDVVLAETEVAAEEEEFDNSVYARLLTDEQKARLVQIAISERAAEDLKDARVRHDRDGDRVLFDVVKRWGDARLASVMLDRLRATGEDNYEKLYWMSSISEILKDKELTRISEKFGNFSYQDGDEEFIDEKDVDSASDNEVEQPKVPVTVAAETDDPGPTVEQETPLPPDGKKVKKTFRQVRDELLSDFFDRAGAAIALEAQKEESNQLNE